VQRAAGEDEVTFSNQSNGVWKATTNSGQTLVGTLEPDVDGFYYFWPSDQSLTGCWAEHLLREVADKLRELNKDWSQMVRKELAGS
jgi:hypothetical protein